jgi:5-formyltetrahydrofolate cyclo-ligase
LASLKYKSQAEKHEMENPTVDLYTRKTEIRKQAHENRKNQPEKDAVSCVIVDRFMELPEYHSAKVVMFYIDVRDEVRTRQALPAALESGKTVIVPYCKDGELELFHLESMDELELGMYRILEPKNELRNIAPKHRNPEDLDLVMVPGVAFDRNGGRTGHGKGYYDKLLQHARKDAPLVALSFECQLFEEIPAESHDIYMDKVVTEKQVYAGRGRS